MLERGKMERGVFEIVDTESLVPPKHLLRKIDAAVDFTRIYDMVEPLYCLDNGRPSTDPVVLFKMVLIQHLYGLPSLRRTAEEVSANMCYRWFLGLSAAGGNTAFFNDQLQLPPSVYHGDGGSDFCVDSL